MIDTEQCRGYEMFVPDFPSRIPDQKRLDRAPGSATMNFEFLTQKIVTRLSEI
jgi:hypothetical protein